MREREATEKMQGTVFFQIPVSTLSSAPLSIVSEQVPASATASVTPGTVRFHLLQPFEGDTLMQFWTVLTQVIPGGLQSDKPNAFLYISELEKLSVLSPPKNYKQKKSGLVTACH